MLAMVAITAFGRTIGLAQLESGGFIRTSDGLLLFHQMVRRFTLAVLSVLKMLSRVVEMPSNIMDFILIMAECEIETRPRQRPERICAAALCQPPERAGISDAPRPRSSVDARRL